MNDILRPKDRVRVPTVPSVGEVARLFAALKWKFTALLARLLYGTGLRLMEALRLRVKDVDFDRREIVVRDGKGGKDRRVMLPDLLAAPLKDQLAHACSIWTQDCESGLPGVFMPDALDRKYPNGGKQWTWFWVWPAPELSIDPRSGIRRRHHLYEQRLQRAIKQAVSWCSEQAGVGAYLAPLLRHSLAGKRLRHSDSPGTAGPSSDVSTTMIYTHVLNRSGRGVMSPVDRMAAGSFYRLSNNIGVRPRPTVSGADRMAAFRYNFNWLPGRLRTTGTGRNSAPRSS